MPKADKSVNWHGSAAHAIEQEMQPLFELGLFEGSCAFRAGVYFDIQIAHVVPPVSLPVFG
jgi:hypothetical protein